MPPDWYRRKPRKRIQPDDKVPLRLSGRIERTRGKSPHRGLAVIADAANPFVNLVGQPHGGTSQVARRRHAAIGAAGVNRRAAQADDAHKFREPHEAAVFGFHSSIVTREATAKNNTC